MTQKRAKENENPEPQTGRGHKLTDRLRNRQLGHEELPNRENVTHRNDGHAPRADSPEGASGRPTARGGGAATSRQRGARDTRGPSPRLSGRLRLNAPTAPAAGKGVEGLERSRTAGGGLRRGALSAEATYKPTARAGHPTPGRRPQSGARPHADLREDVPAATVPAPNQAVSAHAAGWAGGPGGPPSAEG